MNEDADIRPRPLPGGRAALAAAGILLAAVLLEAVLRLGGGAFLSRQRYRNELSLGTKSDYCVLCLGESTTAGQYPAFLGEELARRGAGVKFRVIDGGVPGTNTAGILDGLEENLDKYRPDLVITMMGSNDKGVLYYRDIPEAETWLFRNIRAYRFLRLLSSQLLPAKAGKPPVRRARTRRREPAGRAKRPGPGPGGGEYSAAGTRFKNKGKFEESEKAFRKALELAPGAPDAYLGLAWAYRAQKKFAQAERAVKEAIRLDPANARAWMQLSWAYNGRAQFAARERDALKKVIELEPGGEYAYNQLAWLFRRQGKFAEAERVLKKAVDSNPEVESFCSGLAQVYGDMGRSGLSGVYRAKANALREKYFDRGMTANYRALRRSLDKRGVRLFAMQYPMRSVAHLKRIFGGEPGGAVVFVDNEGSFRDAVESGGYAEYFMDMFGGDFGHCTDKGNRLLAGNAADAILKALSLSGPGPAGGASGGPAGPRPRR